MARRLIMAAAFCAASVPYAAHAACDAANQFTYSFLTAPVASLSYTGSSTYTATNSLGQSISFTVTYAANGLSTNMAGGVAMPAISNLINSTGSGNNLMIGGIFLGRTTSITGTTRTIKTTLTFATTVRDVRVMVNDVDYGANQFRDWMHASGTGPAGAYVPAITTPYTNNNTTGPRSDASSTLTLGAATTPYPITANQAVGTAVSSNTALNGTMYTAWTQPITSAAITYGNYPYAPGENTTGQQAIGIESVQFCPMPVLTVLKSSAPVDDPVNGTTNPKMVPGAHVDYTLTVTNTGGSPVDAGAVVLADVLPATMTLYNADIDTAAAGTQNFVFNPGTSGTTLAAANITYSNNGGTSYTYAPAAGYDPAVQALRFAPQGAMAANSSFSVRFRVRVN